MRVCVRVRVCVHGEEEGSGKVLEEKREEDRGIKYFSFSFLYEGAQNRILLWLQKRVLYNVELCDTLLRQMVCGWTRAAKQDW